jgi:hypothetical protein
MVVFDDRFFPLVVILGLKTHIEQDFETYRLHFGEWSAKKARILVLSDPRAQELPNAYWRRRFAELGDEIQSKSPNVTCANAAVLGSALLVGAARAVSWLRRGQDETFYTSSAVDALEFLIRKGQAEGLRVPGDARNLMIALDACARRGGNPETLLDARG